MKIIEGKSPAERNKIIAALVLGALALLAVGYNVVGLFPSKKPAVARSGQQPSAPAETGEDRSEQLEMPTRTAADFVYESTEITYTPASYAAAAPNRNIFAFYEPPPPTPYVAPTPIFVPPSPTPPPPMQIASLMPQSVYAGSKPFRLEVNGDRFTREARIYFNGSEIPTTFVNDRRVTAEIPSNFIAAEGMRTVRVRTPDGSLYSNDSTINVMAPPKPNFTYLGPLVRKRSNNDTAYIQEQGSQTAVGRRLSDIIGGRFKLISISPAKVVVEDVNLGFRHTVNITNASMQAATGGSVAPTNFVPYNPNIQIPQMPVPNPNVQNPNNRPPQPVNPNQPDDDTDDEEVVDNR
jgi:hypothetical protein